MKPVEVKPSIYWSHISHILTNDENPKIKIGDTAGISQYKNVFAKGYVPNLSEEVFVIKKVKNHRY